MKRATHVIEGVEVEETVVEENGSYTLVWVAGGITVTQPMEHYSNTMIDLARKRARAELLGGS